MTVREALLGIINAANGNPEPIHYKVREAIDKGRAALVDNERTGAVAYGNWQGGRPFSGKSKD